MDIRTVPFILSSPSRMYHLRFFLFHKPLARRSSTNFVLTSLIVHLLAQHCFTSVVSDIFCSFRLFVFDSNYLYNRYRPPFHFFITAVDFHMGYILSICFGTLPASTQVCIFSQTFLSLSNLTTACVSPFTFYFILSSPVLSSSGSLELWNCVSKNIILLNLL